MPLTIIQQLELIKGNLKPESTTLDVLVHQASYNFAKSFYDGSKDTTGNLLATSYASKMYAIAKRVLRNEQGVNEVLTRMIIVIIGSSTFTYAQVDAADDNGWASFVLDKMDEAFEYIADVRKEEKTAYNAI